VSTPALDQEAATNPLLAKFWVEPAAHIDQTLADLRRAGPVFMDEQFVSDIGLETGPGAWVITQHDLILEMSKTPEVYSSASGITVLDLPPEFLEFFSSMIAMDDPQHARLRKLVSAGFTPRMLNRLEDSVRDQADEIISSIATLGRCDFVVDVAARLPLVIVCDLMGVPRSELDFVFEQSNVILGASDPEYVPDAVDIPTALLGAGAALAELMIEVAESKRGGNGDDLTSILVNAELDGERLSFSEIASFFILLVVAGNETTRNAISWGLHYLAQFPEQRALWQNDPDRITSTAVEEIVRLASPVTYMRRTATRDITLGGAEIASGDKLAMFYLAANRDETLFSDPLRFDVQREPNRHLGFGGPGPHFCLGAHLARREIGVMFTQLFARLPDIEATGEIDVLQSSFIHGVKHLTAEFTPI
jgi:cytochrome P450